MALRLITEAELQMKGFPLGHANAFWDTAAQSDCIISSRTPGEACEMLLRKDYDAKGFFIKSKSCNWGPMAGFLCLDPMMNKELMEGAMSNLKETHHSLKDFYDDSMTENAPNSDLKTAESIQIMFDDERLEWLKTYLKAGKFTTINANAVSYTDTTKHLKVLLVKRLVGKQNLWALYYDIKYLYMGEANSDSAPSTAPVDTTFDISKAFIAKLPIAIVEKEKEKENWSEKVNIFWKFIESRKYLHLTTAMTNDLKKTGSTDFNHFVPLMGLTNPRQTYSGDLSYLNAVTGDYDLYAVWPKVPTEADRRIQGMHFKTRDKDIYDGEDNNKIGKAVGNITERIFNIAQVINSLMPSPTGKYPNRVFHSDECGRPNVDEADEAVFFTPDRKIYSIDNATGLAGVIEHFHELGYTCYINKGWERELLDIDAKFLKMVSWSGSI